MLRSKSELIQEVLAIERTNEFLLEGKTKEELIAILHKNLAVNPIPEQINVMLAVDLKEQAEKEIHKLLDSPSGVLIEEKIDGVRGKFHFYRDNGNKVIRIDGRNIVTTDYSYNEFTEKLPHFTGFNWPDHLFNGTILDGEFELINDALWTGKVITKGARSSTIVALNASVDVSLKIQTKRNPIVFKPFDILKYDNQFLLHLPLIERLKILHTLNVLHPQFMSIPYLKTKNYGEYFSFYNSIVNSGGEGVIFKNLQAPYTLGKRKKAWIKIKKTETVDCFVTGWNPGKGKHVGLVGSLEGSVYKEGKPIVVCSVGNFTDEMRKALTTKEGKLNRLYYNLVMEVQFQEKSKYGLSMHARFIRWRTDKIKEECNESTYVPSA